MKTLTRDNSFYSFDKGQECKLWIDPGEIGRIETYDCRCGRLQSHGQLFTTAPAWGTSQPQTNPCTGPIGVNGVIAGQTLRISIHKIDLEKRGFIIQKTEMGICKQLVKDTQVVFGEVCENFLDFECGLRLPIRPHIGTLGVTPVKAVATGFAGEHGGNMDCRFLEPGSAIYLPVQVDGGMIGVGDIHATMGSGELMGTGVEISGAVELSAECAGSITIHNPVLCNGDCVMTIATAPQLQEALEIASADMVDLLERYGGYSRIAALSLLTSVCDAGICQGFDTNIFSVASVSVSCQHLPAFYPVERKETI